MNEVNEKTDNSPDVKLTYGDKILGIFLKPRVLFSVLSKSNVKFTDWLIPPLLVIILFFIIRYLPLSSTNFKNSYIQSSITRYEKYLNDEVSSGRMLKDTADARIKDYRDNSDSYMYTGMYILSMNKLCTTIATFFLVSGLFFLIFKFIFKDNTSFKLILSTYGLSYNIIVFPFLIYLILVIINGAYLTGLFTYHVNLSLNTIFSLNRMSFLGHLFEKINPFFIWFYTVLGIGFAKIFKKENTKKYVFIVYILWIGTDLIFYGLWSLFGGYLRFFIFY